MKPSWDFASAVSCSEGVGGEVPRVVVGDMGRCMSMLRWDTTSSWAAISFCRTSVQSLETSNGRACQSQREVKS